MNLSSTQRSYLTLLAQRHSDRDQSLYVLPNTSVSETFEVLESFGLAQRVGDSPEELYYDRWLITPKGKKALAE